MSNKGSIVPRTRYNSLKNYAHKFVVNRLLKCWIICSSTHLRTIRVTLGSAQLHLFWSEQKTDGSLDCRKLLNIRQCLANCIFPFPSQFVMMCSNFMDRNEMPRLNEVFTRTPPPWNIRLDWEVKWSKDIDFKRLSQMFNINIIILHGL